MDNLLDVGSHRRDDANIQANRRQSAVVSDKETSTGVFAIIESVAEEKCSDQMERAESNTNDVLGERMSATYSNPWYLAGRPQQGPSEYRTDAKPLEYRGFQIFERIPGKCWDVVKDGTCVTQRAGLDGAKRFIDAA